MPKYAHSTSYTGRKATEIITEDHERPTKLMIDDSLAGISSSDMLTSSSP
jgi:hypothetical protein